ncbi:MAG: hypothetical protein QOG90_930 [Actinomycetota bacterium]|jgi:hypothetical protein
MTGMDENSSNFAGPPVRLLSRAERARRRRAVAVSVVIIGTLAIFLTVLTLRFATRPNRDVHLGSNTFRVGYAKTLEARIRADAFPLLFQDLRNNSIDIYVDHQRGKPFYEGWRAIEAHAPEAPRKCQLEWNGSAFTDPCDGRAYPATGQGLRRFEAKVVKGQVIVDFRKRVSTP